MTVEDDRREAETRQQAVVDHLGEGYVQACPGAGKTLTLVRRLERLSSASAPSVRFLYSSYSVKLPSKNSTFPSSW